MKPGSRLKSAASPAEIIIVRPPGQAVELLCSGQAMIAPDGAPHSATPAAADEPVLAVGKRYVDEVSGLEVLVAKPGPGRLSVDGRVMTLREAKALPASD